MTYEEFINSLIPGVQFYDDFRDNGLGVAVPSGWTKLTGQTPEIIADLTAYGGKALKFSNVISGSAPTALVMDDAGTPENYEILMRVRTDAEYTKQCEGGFTDGAGQQVGTSPCEPDGPPFFGGPGGHLSFGGGILRGIGLRGSNRAGSASGGLFWGLGACHLAYKPALGSAYRKQNWYIVASDAAGVWSAPFNGISALMKSGKATLVTGIYICEDNRRVRFVDPPEAGQFGEPLSDDYLPGVGIDVNYIRGTAGNARQYNYMRLRVNGTATRVKWWPGDQTEPLAWLTIESDLPSTLAPPIAGGAGILHVPHTNMSVHFDPHTIVDFVSIALSGSAATPPDVPVASCPLPNGEVGVEYTGTFDPTGLYQPA